MAINEQGYLRPTYDEILEDRIALAQELFGQDIDTSDASALGKFIRLSVQDLADAYEAQEIVYYSRFPHTATGQNLDRLMPFAGITRNPATATEHLVKFTGTPNYEVPTGFLVGTVGDEEFYVLNPIALDESGVGSGIVVCTEFGEIGNVAVGTITEIINPNVDVTSVEHVSREILGKETETDAELRQRFSLAIEGSGSGTASAIRGAVMRVNGVTGCLVIENDTNETVGGRPPHSFEVFVYASNKIDQEVAEAIFSKKPLGIHTVGDISVDVHDVAGNIHAVKFSRVSETTIYIQVTVATNNDFELDGVEQIQNALEEHINSLGAGEDVVFTSLYKHIFGVVGVKDVTSLGISKDGSTYNAQNVIMDASHVARISAENIAVEVMMYEDN